MNRKKRCLRTMVLSITTVIICLTGRAVFAENINPSNDGSKHAYGENTGWLNFQPAFGPGVTVNAAALLGFAWGENIGWINLSPVFGGVHNDGAGMLSGFAWAENAGWINFAPIGGGVVIDQCGDFNGKAWGENTGWITFRSGGANPYKVATSWAPPVDTFLPVTEVTQPGPAWRNTDVSVVLFATDNDCGSGVKEVHSTLNSDPEVIIPGSGFSTVITPEGIHTFNFFAADNAGNLEASRSLTFKIDKSPPVITLTTPTEGASFLVNSVVSANYNASDALSGLDTLIGTVPNGNPIDTAAVGTKAFSVTATDLVGNSAAQNVNYLVTFPGNIDPGNNEGQYAWAENAGWINFQPVYGPGVTITDTAVTGKAWGENLGWVNLSPMFGGVANDGTGTLSGFAWAENAGWINFAPTHGGVSINPVTGEFSGDAWGENVGWIRFRGTGAIPYGITTAWRGLLPPLPGDLDLDGDVDRADIHILLQARNQPAQGANDPRDLD